MKKNLIMKKRNILFITKILKDGYFEVDNFEGLFEKKLERINFKIEKILIEKNIDSIKDKKLYLKLEKRKDELKNTIKEIEKELFEKNKNEEIKNKKLIIVTNNKGIKEFIYNEDCDILNRNKSKENIQFWISNLSPKLCQKSYIKYFNENECDDVENLLEMNEYTKMKLDSYDEKDFNNKLIKLYDIKNPYKIINFLDYNFFNEKDNYNLLKLIISKKLIGDLQSKDVSLKAFLPCTNILKILNPILDRKIGLLYELKVKDLKILFADVNKL